MKKFFDWISHNKIAFVLILILGFLVIKNSSIGINTLVSSKRAPSYSSTAMMGSTFSGIASPSYDSAQNSGMMYNPGIMPIRPQPAPYNPTTDRKVITEANMSLQVSSINQTVDNVKNKLNELQGILLDVNINRPEFGETATLVVRVPSDKVEDFLAFARKTAVKVVNENISGSDYTDQYVDTDTRLLQLRQQLSMLQNILKSATNVDEIMKVQPYINDVQSQIDNLIGQNNFIDKSSQSSRITLFLSTDELSLPYTPDLAWRPQAVFKNAVRSLLVTLQKMGSAMIWLGVYSILIVPAFTILLIVYLALKKKNRI